MRARLACTAVIVLAGSLLSACSDDGEPASSTSTAATTVGDNECDDPIGDVYLTTDATAAPTGRAPGIDLVHAEALLDGDELKIRFETAEPASSVEFPELIVFGGAAEDPNRFEIRAVGSPEGWVVRRVTFVDGPPVDAAMQATVEAHGAVVTFTVRAGLLPVSEFVAFSFASTGNEDSDALNDECFPFVGRAPVGS
jgi:hypothetical protein